MLHIVCNADTGMYVADMRKSGVRHSYTKRLEHARVFSGIDDARRDACENEYVVTVAEVMGS